MSFSGIECLITASAINFSVESTLSPGSFLVRSLVLKWIQSTLPNSEQSKASNRTRALGCTTVVEIHSLVRLAAEIPEVCWICPLVTDVPQGQTVVGETLAIRPLALTRVPPVEHCNAGQGQVSSSPVVWLFAPVVGLLLLLWLNFLDHCCLWPGSKERLPSRLQLAS
jgi:hypothetical protein